MSLALSYIVLVIGLGTAALLLRRAYVLFRAPVTGNRQFTSESAVISRRKWWRLWWRFRGRPFLHLFW